MHVLKLLTPADLSECSFEHAESLRPGLTPRLLVATPQQLNEEFCVWLVRHRPGTPFVTLPNELAVTPYHWGVQFNDGSWVVSE